jgi:predicted RNA-binding Zn ribbon-like protein
MATSTHLRAEPTEPIFIADDVALDFLNTAFGAPSAPRECLYSDQQVLDWLRRTGLLPDLNGAPPSAKRGVLLSAALALRAHARELLEKRKGRALGDPSELNRLLALGNTHQELIWKKGQSPKLARRRMAAAAEAVLAPLAEAIAQLLAEGDFDLIRKCESPDCTLWFYDRTKSHHRRWCSMAICGNRAKVAAYRARRRA